MVKIKNIESPHVKPLLTSLQKVSLLVLIIVDSAIKKSQLREKYTELTASLSFAKALLFTAALDHYSSKNMMMISLIILTMNES